MIYLRKFEVFVWLIFLISCQKISGQEISAGDVKVTGTQGLLFYDPVLKSKVKATGVARVVFKDSITLEPISSNVTIFRMKNVDHSSKDSQINFAFFYARENDLDERERMLLDKYSLKVDSIFMNAKYQFIGKEKWLYGRRLDLSFSFEVEPR